MKYHNIKRIINSSLLILFLCLFGQKASAQAFNTSVAVNAANPFIPPQICGQAGTTYTAIGHVVAGAATANQYTWAIINPPGATSTLVPIPPAPNLSVGIAVIGCGVYTLISTPLNTTVNPGFTTPIICPSCPNTRTFEIICSNGNSITPAGTTTNNALCLGNTATLTGNGAATYTWVAQTGNNPPVVTAGSPSLVTTPVANTSYTVTGTTAIGCIISATYAIAVQAATLNNTPASATICPGAPLCFTATAVAGTTPNFAGPTTISGFTWVAPSGPVLTPGAVKCTNAVFGTYSVNMSYSGPAGTCTLQNTTQVFTIATVSVGINGPLNGTICPGANGTYSAFLIGTQTQTVAAAYSWSVPTGPLTFSVAAGVNPITRSATIATIYTVGVNYYGCTGTAQYTVNMGSITPTITPNAPNVCPNRTVTLSATGGQSYTFSAFPAAPAPPVSPLVKPTFSSGIHVPTQANFPISYCVDAYSLGCTGSACTTVGILVLTPTIIPSSPSICPGSTVGLTVSGGAGTDFTLATISGFSIIGSASVPNYINHNPAGQFAHQYSVTVDSAGCVGDGFFSLDSMVLVPTIVPSSPSVCPGTAFTLVTTGGAGSNYVYVAPANLVPPSMTVSGNQAIHSIASPTDFPATYTVHVDSATCKGKTDFTILLRTLFPVVSPSTPSICASTQFTLNSTGGAGTNYTFTAPYLMTPPSSSVIPKSLATDNFAVHTPTVPIGNYPLCYTVTVDSAGCKGSGVGCVGILSLGPQLTLTVSSPSVCPGTNFTLTASGAVANYTFLSPVPNPTPPIIQSGSTAIHSYSPLGAGVQYTVVADSAGCKGSATVDIYELTLKNIALAANPTLVCAGMPVTLTTSGGGAGTTYTFGAVSPTGIPIPNGTTTFVVVNPTVNTVYGVYADSSGCKSPTAPPPLVNVSLYPALSLTASASSASVCSGTSATLSVAGPTNALYSWYQPSGGGSVQIGPSLTPPSTSIVVNPTVNTIYTVSAIDPLGCVGTATVLVAMDPLATLPVTISVIGSTICPTLPGVQNVTLTASGGLSYTWSPPGGLNTTLSPSVIAQPSVTTVYTFTGSNNAGCFGTASHTVIVGNPPNLSIAATANSVCPGFSSTLTAFGANSYTWTGTTFTYAIYQQSISVGPGIYKLIGSNGGSCIDSTSANSTFTVGLAPPLVITVAQTSGTTCIANNNPKYSKPVVLTASGAGTYVWFPYNPFNMTYSLGPTTTVRPPASTQYTVIGATSICSGSAVVQVNVIPQFTMNVVPPLPAMCLGDSLKLSILNIGPTSLAVGPTSAFNYSWTEAANAPPISISNVLTSTVMVFPQNTTTYTVEVLDSRKCVSIPRLVTVTVLPRPLTAIAIPTINSVPTNTVCFVGLNPGAVDNILTLTGTNKNTNLQFGVVPTYTWASPYPSKYTSLLTPINNNAVTVNAPLKLPSVVVYTLTSGYNGVPGCLRIDTVSVRVIDCRPVTNANVGFTTAEKNDTICVRQCITFINLTDTAAGGTQTLSWQFDGGSPKTSTAQIPTVCYNLPGKFNVILRVKNPYPLIKPDGSSGSEGIRGDLSFVKVVDVPNVTIVPPGQLLSDTTIRFGQSVNLTASGAQSYAWGPSYNISALTGKNVKVSPFRTTQYILTGYNSASCSSADTLNVIVIEDCGEMFVPNAFSPNGDGHNDVMKVNGICLQSLTFMIFNRWGEKVFETNDQSVGWDGTYKGEVMNTGVFVYRLEGKTYDGKGYSLKGNITLVR